MKTICLAAIVRDEAELIEKSLLSVLPMIDSYCIVDTGSVDDTIAIVRETLKNIPGVIHEREWKSHQHNRTELLELAHGTADYLMLLDADCVVHGELPVLTDDLYTARIKGGFSHTLDFLLNGRDVNWNYKGAAHAFLAADRAISSSLLDGVTVEEMRSSSPRTDKIARDAEALEAEIDPRTVFYLAQSYRDLGYTEPAADLYRLRVRQTAAHPQERYWACYSEGLCRLQLDWDRGVRVLMEAYNMRPSRAEAPWLLAKELRVKGWPHAALLFAEAAAELPMTGDTHFSLAWVYEYGARQERANCRTAVGDTDGARHDFEILAQRDDEVGDWARGNIIELVGAT